MKMRRFKYVTVVIEYNLYVSHSFTILNLIQRKNEKILTKKPQLLYKIFLSTIYLPFRILGNVKMGKFRQNNCS